MQLSAGCLAAMGSDFYDTIFGMLGKKYEVLVYERSRRQSIAAQRTALKINVEPDTAAEDRLRRDIELTERLLALIAADRNL